jgi:hypothetical protein
MKKFLLIAVAVSSLLFASKVYAGGVTDNNNGNKGYILVSTGENNGTNSIGHWTDPSFLKGDTGERGETGATGQDGQAGRDGLDGQAGINGQDGQAGRDGQDGINGLDGQAGRDGQDGINGQDGQDGINGQKGDTGSQGEQGIEGNDGATGQAGRDGQDGQAGINGQDGQTGATGQAGEVGKTGDTGSKGDIGETGQDGKTPIKNIDYFDGINGLNGIDGKGVDPKTVNELNNKIDNNSNRIDKLEESQYIVGGVLRIKSTKKWDVDLFADYSTNRQMIDRSGIRFTYKVGTSYTDKRINDLEKRLNNLENR